MSGVGMSVGMFELAMPSMLAQTRKTAAYQGLRDAGYRFEPSQSHH